MDNPFVRLGLVVVCLFVLAIFYEAFRLRVLVVRGRGVVERSRAYERPTPSGAQRILVAGDSAAAGTGAEKPELSLAGRLGATFPKHEVVNLGVNGLKVAGLVEVLEGVSHTDHYRFMLLQIGGNNVIRFTPLEVIDRDIRRVLTLAKERAE